MSLYIRQRRAIKSSCMKEYFCPLAYLLREKTTSINSLINKHVLPISLIISHRWTDSPKLRLMDLVPIFASVCASATISQKCPYRFYSLLAQRQHMIVYICMSFFFSRSDLRWPTGRHFSRKKKPMLNASSTISQTCTYRCCANLAYR